MKNRLIILVFVSSFVLDPTSFALAGHTRPAYLDGCQSMDGRYVVTAEPIKEKVGKKELVKWKYHWKDAKTNETHSGWLTGPRGLGHFDVTYGHLFMPPGGETFALWLTACWAESDMPHPKGNQAKYSEELAKHPAFGSRLTIYKKTGEILKKYDMRDILKSNEWVYVNWVQGNMYWLMEYPEVMKGGEPPRCGWRYYRISPDYSTLEFVIGPNADAVHKIKGEPETVRNYRRTVRIDLTNGAFLDPTKKLGNNKVPGRPFCDDLINRGDAKGFQSSLDPVRVKGKYVTLESSK